MSRLVMLTSVAEEGPWCGTHRPGPPHLPGTHSNGGGGGGGAGGGAPHVRAEFSRGFGDGLGLGGASTRLSPQFLAELIARLNPGAEDAIHPQGGGWAARLAAAVEPHPDPWRLGTITTGLYGAIALQRISTQLAAAGERATGEAVGTAAETLFDDVCGSIPISVLIQMLLHNPPPPPPPWLEQIEFAARTLAMAAAMPVGDVRTQFAKAAAQSIHAALGGEGDERQAPAPAAATGRMAEAVGARH